VVYVAESPAGALIETCVHTSANDIPPSFTMLKVVGPDLPFDEIELAMLDPACFERAEIRVNWVRNG